MIVDIDHAMEMIRREMQAAEDQVVLARTRALRKTGNEIRTRIRKMTAKKERMPQRAISGRFFVSRVTGEDDHVRVWIGTADVDAMTLGRASQNRRGVRVGRRSYRGAFLARIYTNREKVWIRRSSRHFDPDRYPTRRQHRRGYHGNLPASMRGRFPVVKAAVPIDDTVQAVIKDQEAEFETIFLKHYRHELNYLVNVRAGA